MRNRLSAAVIVAAVVVLSYTASAAAATHLQPGVRSADLSEQVPVNVVFVGYDREQVDTSAFLAGLPSRYKPVVRSRLWYGAVEELGLDYSYDYPVTFASSAWENEFFGALRGLAKRAARTEFQEAYNEQEGTRDVGQNHFIDAPAVERWLIDHAPVSVDTRRNTIFFINWWGRSDFIDHVYTKFGEPDPDTGYDFGANHETRKIIAWGGTTPDDEETGLGRRGEQRVWFHDLSAGPESWAGSFDITNPDLDGDDEPDYRIPPAWEYAAGGYRAPSLLTGDLAKLTRYVAVNLIFTSSPIYPPYLTPELLPATINVDLNTYEGWPGVDASAQYQKPGYVRDELSELSPMRVSVDTQDLRFHGRARRCYVLWIQDVPCFGDRPQYPAFANLFVYNALNLEDALDQDISRSRGRPSRLYEAPNFNYATSEELSAPFLGFADDNYLDGTQSFVFNFISPGIAESGYGLTTTQIHENGHHFGMSHPHDGFDWEAAVDYEPTGPFYFAWAGDEQNSMMSYIDLNWDFSQFDRDNAARHQAAGYILNANVIAGWILESRRAHRAARLLAAADFAVGQAKAAIAAHDYTRTWRAARIAYELVLRGARRARVAVEPSYNGWYVLPNERTAAPAVSKPILPYAAFDRIGPGTKRSGG